MLNFQVMFKLKRRLFIDELLDSLNGMHKLMTGQDDSFDREFYDELVQCIQKYDTQLLNVINAQWNGFKLYANRGGNPGVDDWVRCETRVKFYNRSLFFLSIP